MNDTIFRILAAIIILIGASISIYYRTKADREAGGRVSLKEEGTLITVTLRLLGISLWVAMFAYLINPAWVAWARVDLPEWIRWVGVSLGAASDGLAYWVFTSLGNNVSPTVVTRKTHSLVTTGPYRWVRHPLYLMGMIAYLGFALLSENAFIALVVIFSFIVLDIRLPKEEARLVDRFGDDYRAYMHRTGKYLPKLRS